MHDLKGDTKEAEDRREPTQHSVLPCLAGGEGWRGDDLYCDGHTVQHLHLDRNPGRELLSCELLAIPAVAVSGVFLNVHKTPTSPKSRKEGRCQLTMYTQYDTH